MNYQKIYNALIYKAAGRKKLRRDHPDYVYYERHHITPVCLGGDNDKTNLAMLTAEEHWLAHLLLVKMNPGINKLVYACQAMSMTSGNNKRTTNKLFGWIRREYRDATSKRQKGCIVSQETKDRISVSLKGRPAPHQQGDNNVSKRPEVAKKISAGLTGRKMIFADPEGRKKKIAQANKGHRGATGDANPASRRVSCVFCRKETALPNLSRDHKNCPK